MSKEPMPQRPDPRMTNVDRFTAQAELDEKLFPHYLLGRLLAVEVALAEVIPTLSPKKRAEVFEKLTFHADMAMESLKDPPEEATPAECATQAGLLASLCEIGAYRG